MLKNAVTQVFGTRFHREMKRLRPIVEQIKEHESRLSAITEDELKEQNIDAENVEEADKLIKIIVDLGNEKRTIFAGIKGFYEAENLIGKNIVVVANLEPRKMRFGVSEGMLLAAGDDQNGVFLVAPDTGASPGMRVR